jgi:hypothetical protein
VPWYTVNDYRVATFDHKRPTLAGWLRKPRDIEQAYLVVTTHHYLIVKGRKIIDNHFPDGVWLRQYKGRRARVERVWAVGKGRGNPSLPARGL